MRTLQQAQKKKVTGAGAASGAATVSGIRGGRLAQHTIWGNIYDGTQDVTGPIDAENGSINSLTSKELEVTDKITAGRYDQGTSIENPDGTLDVIETPISTVVIDRNGIDVLSQNTNEDVYLERGAIVDKEGVSAAHLYAKKADINNGRFSTLFGNEITGNTVNVRDLTVTGTAKFFELIVDKIQSARGSLMISPGGSFEVEMVTDSTVSGKPVKKLYWQRGADTLSNDWQVGDMAVSMTFTLETGNRYFWTEVIETGTYDYLYHSENGNGTIKYNYITVKCYDADGTVNPQVGDVVAMCGNRTNADRQNAIYITAYAGLDIGDENHEALKAPYMCYYKGIKTYNLTPYRISWFSAGGNKIQGDLEVISEGQPVSVEDYINQRVAELKIDDEQIKLAVTNYINGSTIKNDIAQLVINSDQIKTYVQKIDDNTKEISQIKQDSAGIESRVTVLEGDEFKQSIIKQAADEIKLSSENIVLDGNTTVTGTFSVNSDQGMILRGDNINTNIINTDVSSVTGVTTMELQFIYMDKTAAGTWRKAIPFVLGQDGVSYIMYQLNTVPQGHYFNVQIKWKYKNADGVSYEGNKVVTANSSDWIQMTDTNAFDISGEVVITTTDGTGNVAMFDITSYIGFKQPSTKGFILGYNGYIYRSGSENQQWSLNEGGLSLRYGKSSLYSNWSGAMLRYVGELSRDVDMGTSGSYRLTRPSSRIEMMNRSAVFVENIKFGSGKYNIDIIVDGNDFWWDTGVVFIQNPDGIRNSRYTVNVTLPSAGGENTGRELTVIFNTFPYARRTINGSEYFCGHYINDKTNSEGDTESYGYNIVNFIANGTAWNAVSAAP